MKNAGRPNSLLVELVIVLFFFSLSTAVILQLFIAAHDKSVRDMTDSAATLMAEDYAERFAQSRMAAEKFLEENGFEREGDIYARAAEADGRSLRLTAQPAQENTGAGTLSTVDLTIFDGDTVAIRLPLSCYVPGEEAL